MIPYHEVVKEARTQYIGGWDGRLWIERITTHQGVRCWVIVYDERGYKLEDDLFIIKFASSQTKLIRHLLETASEQMFSIQVVNMIIGAK